MIKGVLIFSAGVGVGYGVAIRNQEPNGEVKEALAEFLTSMKAIVNDAWLDTKNEMAKAKQKEEAKPPDAEGEAEEESRPGDVPEVAEEESRPDDAPEVVEVDEVIDPDDPESEQGETS